MTSTEITQPATAVAARTPDRIGQATAVEQARAVAEVQAAIVVAQQCPRNTSRAISAMRESCDQLRLAERAFFRYNRAGSQITGPSVHLAREVARCWGNMQYGIAELRRDDVAGESEMQAYAWDVEANTRAVSVFVVKHIRDTQKGTKQLTEQRDIYENNANMGARRLREAIFSILPTWFTEEAQERCRLAIEKGSDDKPLPTRVANAVKGFGDRGVSVPQLEAKLGRTQADWTAHDVAQLHVIFTSLNRGEITVADEFEPQVQKVTAAEIAGQASPAPAPPSLPTPPEPDPLEPTQEELDAMAAEQT